jgi:membrane protein implicated in regulation of membrane protease activity
MSAVATTESLPMSPARAVHAHSNAGTSALELEAAEQKRWLLWFGTPVLIAAIFVGFVFGTGQQWYLALAVSAIVADIGVLVWLSMSSDTNRMIGETAPSHH